MASNFLFQQKECCRRCARREMEKETEQKKNSKREAKVLKKRKCKILSNWLLEHAHWSPPREGRPTVHLYVSVGGASLMGDDAGTGKAAASQKW